MSTIERLAELARRTVIEEWVWQGSYFVRRTNGDPIAELVHTYGTMEDAEYIAACNPAAIAQAAAEYAAMREQVAALAQQLEAAERREKGLVEALIEIAEWTEKYTSPGHPISTIARKMIKEKADAAE